MLDGPIVVLDDKPQLLFRLGEHGGQVHLVAMKDPVAFFFTDYFGDRSLILLKTIVWFDLKGLLTCPDINLELAFVPILNFLFPKDFACPIVSNCLSLQLLAFKIE